MMVVYEKKPLPDERRRYLGGDTPLLVWLLIMTIVLTIAVILIFDPNVNAIINARSEVQRMIQGGSGYELASDEEISLYPVGSYQVRIEQGGLLYLDAKGREHAWHETNLLSARIISRSYDSLILSDKDSPEFVVAKESGIVFADKVKSKAVGADLRGDDLLVLDQGKDNKGEIRYYDLSHNEMKFVLEYQESGYPLLARIAPSGNYFDVLILDIDQVDPECLVQRYGLDGKKKSEVRLSGYFGSFLHGTDDVVAAYCGDRIILADMETEDLTLYAVPEGFSHLLADRTGIIVLGTASGAEESWLVRLSSAGDNKTTAIPLLSAAPVAADGWLLLPSDKQLYLYDLTDSVLTSSVAFEAPLRQVYLAPGGRALIITTEAVIPFLIQ